MPLSSYLAEAILNQVFGDTAYSTPATIYIGQGTAPSWAASTAVASGAYVVGSAFASSNRHIYKCTTAGTTGSTEPSWNQGAGSTTADGTAVWTEMTNLLAANTISGLEISTGGYQREGVTNNTTNWPSAVAGPPASKANGTAVTFPTPTATWPQAVVTLYFDASSGGNLLAYALLPTPIVAGLSSSPGYAIGAVSVTLA